MRKDDISTLGFAAIVCVVCSLIISTAAALLKEKQDFNFEVDRKTNVLKAFDVENAGDLSGEEVEAIFAASIEEVVIDIASGQEVPGMTGSEISFDDKESNKKLPIYLWKENGETRMYAFPLHGMGLWSTVYSYIALGDNLATIKGVTFYGHKETPGLGGECSADWFQNQFKGKKIWDSGNYVNFEVVKGGVGAKYPEGSDTAVDGMSGATMTGNGIMKFINSYVQLYGKYFDQQRNL